MGAFISLPSKYGVLFIQVFAGSECDEAVNNEKNSQ